LMTACTAPVAIVHSPTVPTASATPSATIFIVTPHGPPPDAELCGGAGDERARALLDDVMFAQCDRFVPAFEAAVQASCDGITPLTGALKHIDDARRLDGTYSRGTRMRRNEVLGKAALPLMKERCEEHFEQPMKRRTWTFPIRYFDEDWTECAPNRELIEPMPNLPLDEAQPTAAPVGVALFAAALTAHVSPRGVRHVRKFLVCETIEKVVGEIRGKPEIPEWFGGYLVTPPLGAHRD